MKFIGENPSLESQVNYPSIENIFNENPSTPTTMKFIGENPSLESQVNYPNISQVQDVG